MDASTAAGFDWQQQMKAQMASTAMIAPAVIIADGKMHRFDPEGGMDDAGWYVVYAGERFTNWAFGDWRQQTKYKGHTKPGKKLNRKELREALKQARERREKINAEQLAAWEKAAEVARARWASLKPASPLHEYLKKKKVEPSGARQDGVNLVIAMTSIDDGKIWSWREITPDGFKSNQKGARQKGCYFRIGDVSDVYVVCEGFSTGASLAMVQWYTLPGFFGTTRVPCILVAGDAGNMIHIAKGVRKKHPDAIIILAADDDWLIKGGNPGLTAAQRAAKVVNGILVKPWFDPVLRQQKQTDFNDQHCAYGLDEVRETIRLAMIEHEEAQEAIKAKAGPFGDPPDDSLPPIDFPSSNEALKGTEDWLALALVNRHADEWRYVPRWGMWMHFRGGRWIQDERNRTFTYARKVCRAAATEGDKSLGKSATVAAVERLARYDERMATAVEEWDRDPWLLNTPDGTVDLHTGVLRPHKRSEYVTKITAVAPKDMDCPLFMAFLRKITDNDEELIGFHLRSLGYAMTGLTKEHALFFWYGTGGNGKSVLLNTVTSILNEYHTSASMETFVESRFGDRHPTELASLRGAHLVTAVETEKGRNWAENKIKALTGGDPITARFMRQDFFTYMPYFTLIIAGNHKPSLRSVDQAIRRRLYLVPFVISIPMAEQDKDLFEKLKAEWPGILHLLIQGCLEWQRIGLAAPKVVTDATEEYLASEDTITVWIEDRCVVDADCSEKVGDLFASYSDWAQKAGERWGSQKDFKQALDKTGLVRFQRTKRGSEYFGLKINPMRAADAA
jgi:putative DNA primase/helicase